MIGMFFATFGAVLLFSFIGVGVGVLLYTILEIVMDIFSDWF